MKQTEELQILIDRIPYAEGNIGEEAILASLLQDLEACGIRHIKVLSNQPERTQQRHGDKVQVLPDKPATWLSRPFEVKKSDLLVWGGGHMLQDRSSQLYIPYVVKTLLLAKFLRKPRFIYSPGLGPVVNSFGKFLSKLAIAGSQAIVVRDKGSFELLKEIGVTQHIYLNADPAFSLKTPHDKQPLPKTGEAPVIGFAPRRLFYRKGSILPVSMQLTMKSRQDDRFEKFMQNSAEALDLFIEKKGARIKLIPMDIGPNPRDDLICHQLKKRMRYPESVEVMDDDPPLNEFIRRLGELNLLVSARLHGIILGLRYGLPFLGIDSDGKIPRLAGAIGVSDRVISDSDFERDRFYNLAFDILEKAEELRSHLLKEGIKMRDQAEKNREILQETIQSLV